MGAKRIDRAGFTFVELLVVTGIIALLISILLPTLGRARAAAATVKCLASHKQLATASIMYENDNRGVLPPIAYSGYPLGGFWPDALVNGRDIYGTSNSSQSKDKGRQSVFLRPQGEITAISNNGNTAPFTSGPMKQIHDYDTMNFQDTDYPTDANQVVTCNYGANGIQPNSGYIGSTTASLVNGRPMAEYFPFCAMPTDAQIAAGALTTPISYLRPQLFKANKAKQAAIVAMYFDGTYCHDRAPRLHDAPSRQAERHVRRTLVERLLPRRPRRDGPGRRHAAAIPRRGPGGPVRIDVDNSKLNTNNKSLWKVRFIVKPTV